MKRITIIKLCLTVFLVLIFIEAHAQEKSIERVVSEKFITKIEGYIEGSMGLSPDNRHVAYLRVQKKFLGGVNLFVVLDGKELKKYDSIGRNSLIFSPDSKRLAYVASSGTYRSPSRPGYVRLSGEMFVVVDGEEGKRYEVIGDRHMTKFLDLITLESGPPVFSPDGKRMAYVAQEKGAEGMFVVIDEKEERHYDWIGNREEMTPVLKPGRPVFSPDSQRIAYSAQKAKKVFVVVDGNEGKQYDDVKLLTFSPDGKHLAYAAKRGVKWLVVMDDKEDKEHDGIGLLTFSPDSMHLTYRIQEGKEMFVVLDGQEGKRYIMVLNPIFSPDSNRLAYVAQEGHKSFMVIDKKEMKKYDGIGFSPRSPFSPDSNHVAYGAQIGKEMFTVLDETENEKHYDRVDDFIFSPDSKHFAYAAVTNNKWFVVVDGKEQKQYDEVASLIFSPDSKRFAYAAFRDKKQFVVLNRIEGKRYNGIFNVGGVGTQKLIFDSPDTFHYLAAEGNSVYLVEEIIK